MKKKKKAGQSESVKWALPMHKGVAWLGVPFWRRERGWMGRSSLLTPDALLSGGY